MLRQSHPFFLDSSLLPQAATDVVMHFCTIPNIIPVQVPYKITGKYSSNVKNDGLFPLVRTVLSHHGVVLTDYSNTPLFSELSTALKLIRRLASIQISNTFEIRGTAKVLTDLWALFLTGKIVVEETATITALGYSRDFDIPATVPVTNAGVINDCGLCGTCG